MNAGRASRRDFVRDTRNRRTNNLAGSTKAMTYVRNRRGSTNVGATGELDTRARLVASGRGVDVSRIDTSHGAGSGSGN